MSSSSAIADALVTMLSAASVFGSGHVSKSSYKILETSSGSCAVVQFVALTDSPAAFGDPRDTEQSYTHEVSCWSKDTGDPDAVLNRIYSMVDGVVACLRADETLLGTVDQLGDVRASFDPHEPGRSYGGAAWWVALVEVDSEKL